MAAAAKPKSSEKGTDATEWLQLVLATVSAIALTIIYVLLPGGSSPNTFVQFAQACIPNVVTALLVFPVLYLVLGRVGLRSEDRLIRRVEQAVSNGGVEGVVLNDVSGMSEMVRDIVARAPRKGTISIEILAFTGGTFTTDLLRDLLPMPGRKFDLTLRAIDFSVAQKDVMPPHWEREENETIRRLPELCEGKANLDIWLYPSFPFLLGLLINESDLFVAFPSWDIATGKLADKSLEYRYYSRGGSTEHIFELFENWANQPRQVLQHTSRVAA